MRIAFIILLIIHSLIHLFGFLKAYNIVKFEAITEPITKPLGLVWLGAFLIFALTVALYLNSNDIWWISGAIAIVVSQILIIMYWSDAKYGTIANGIILVVCIIAYANYSFTQTITAERKILLNKAEAPNTTVVGETDISRLPQCVQNWLIQSGVVGKSTAQNVHLIQDLKLKLKPEQEEWYQATAEQYFSVDPPAFLWTIESQMNPILKLRGRDKFENGEGSMLIKLLTLIPVANVSNNEKINQAALQRYLAEIVWFPSAALSPYITWEPVDELSAKATLRHKGTTGSGIFHFDRNGDFKKFVCLRYMEANDKKPTEWRVEATKIKELNGVRIPVECQASWKLKNESWTWLKVQIKHVSYTVDELNDVKGL